jgi:hypothetical protein
MNERDLCLNFYITIASKTHKSVQNCFLMFIYEAHRESLIGGNLMKNSQTHILNVSIQCDETEKREKYEQLVVCKKRRK